MRHRVVAPIVLSLVVAGLAASAACRRPSPAAAEEAASAGDPGPAAPGVVQLSEEAVKTGGIVVEPVRAGELAQVVSATGHLELDPRRLATLAARVEGRLERVTAFRGDRVAAGQALAEIYSREFLALQADLVQAAARVKRLRGTPDEPGAAAFLDAARAKLLPLGLTAAEADAIASSGAVRDLLPVRAPFAGRVVEQSAVTGDAVSPGESLFRVADLSRVWASVHVQEKDLGAVRTGVSVALRLQAYPDEEFAGKLTVIEGTMDEASRIVEARVEVPNPDGRLRPGMFVEAAIPAGGPARRGLQVPEGALQELPSGPAVFVRTAPGRFELRAVERGARSGDRVEIRRGLAEGEEVVTAGSFVLKSELLKGSLGD